MKFSELKSVLNNEATPSDIALNEIYSIEVYKPDGETCNIKVRDNIVAQLYFDGVGVRVYLAEVRIFLEMSYERTHSIDDDITALLDIVPQEFLTLLTEYVRRRNVQD